jgi:hypothetical protein
MSTAATSDFGSEILVRVINPSEGGMPVEAARVMLQFKLAPSDRDRVNELAAKARNGSLTPDEEAQLREYERVAALVELLQSKARVSLKQAGLSP